jgi:FkbM family methyltransferase
MALRPRDANRLWGLFWESHHLLWTGHDMRPIGDPYRLPVPGSDASVWLRPGTSDPIVYYDCLIDRQYTRALEGTETTIVDAGCNIGMASLAFLVACPNSRILAVECDPENAELARLNLKAFRHRVEVVEAALVPTHQPVALAAAGRGTWASHVEPARDGTLTTITPDECIDRMGRRVDVFKIDIEGGEQSLTWGFLERCQTLLVEPETEEGLARIGREATRQGVRPFYAYRDVVGYRHS